MGSRIPRPIRLQVIRKWLEGTFRDNIAEELKISQGAVSSIIVDFRKDDSQFELLREVAVKIKKQDMDPITFAPLIRLYEVLREKGSLTGATVQESLVLLQKRMEAFIVAFEVFCFNQNLSIEDFVGLVTNMYSAADILGIPIDRFPDYIMDLNDRIHVQLKELERLEAKKSDMLAYYNMTSELLQEYNAERPLIEKTRRLEQALADAKQALKNEKFFNKVGEELEWSVYEGGTETLNIEHLKEMVMEVFHLPSQYPNAIREMKHKYDLRHKEKEQQDAQARN